MCRVFTAASTQEDVFLREGTIALERVMAVLHEHNTHTQNSLISLAHNTHSSFLQTNSVLFIARVKNSRHHIS